MGEGDASARCVCVGVDTFRGPLELADTRSSKPEGYDEEGQRRGYCGYL